MILSYTHTHTHMHTPSADSLQREVTTGEVKEFEVSYGVPVLPIDNTPGPRLPANPSLPDGKEGIKVRGCGTKPCGRRGDRGCVM